MERILTYIFAVIVILSFSVKNAYADEVADGSAKLRTVSAKTGFDFRAENLRNFLLKFNSPLADFAPDFVMFADTYGIDYRLVPSISGVESTFGKFIPSARSFNAYGWAGGEYIFNSWPDSINVVSSTLKQSYIDRGATTIYRISRIYAPPSTTWAGSVTYFVRKIDSLPLNFDII